MNWIKITEKLPDKTYCSCCCEQDDKLLVHGYDTINYSRKYDIMYRDDLAELKPQSDGRYIVGDIIISHWAYIDNPHENKI